MRFAGPDGIDRHQVGQIHGIDQRTAHIFHTVTGQRTEIRFHGIDRFNARGKTQMVDGFFHLAGRFFQCGAVFHHQYHGAGIVTLRHKTAVGFSNGRLRIGGHARGILINDAAV